MMKRRWLLMVVLGFVALTACGGKPAGEQILGQWKSSNTGVVTFSPTGYVYMEGLDFLNCWYVEGKMLYIFEPAEKPVKPTTNGLDLTVSDTKLSWRNGENIIELDRVGATNTLPQAAKLKQVEQALSDDKVKTCTIK